MTLPDKIKVDATARGWGAMGLQFYCGHLRDMWNSERARHECVTCGRPTYTEEQIRKSLPYSHRGVKYSEAPRS